MKHRINATSKVITTLRLNFFALGRGTRYGVSLIPLLEVPTTAAQLGSTIDPEDFQQKSGMRFRCPLCTGFGLLIDSCMWTAWKVKCVAHMTE